MTSSSTRPIRRAALLLAAALTATACQHDPLGPALYRAQNCAAAISYADAIAKQPGGATVTATLNAAANVTQSCGTR